MNNFEQKCIGIIDSVSTKEIKVFLLDDAPKSVSIYEGSISFFPRINSYLVIPNETGWLVGIIGYIGYNHMNDDYNEVNLPRGLRIIYLNILGSIKETYKGLKFDRGAFTLPTVGDSVLLPTKEQLSAIVHNDNKDTISIGTSPLVGGEEIRVSVNELFGRHLAVLGNTGSGKSCTVAGIIRWSIEESIKKRSKSPNARFIILDPNGEYRHAFDDLDINVSYCTVGQRRSEQEKQLRVPAWMWTSNEWSGILQASGKTQKPILREALRGLKANSMGEQLRGSSKIDVNVIRLYLYSMECFLTKVRSTQEYFNSPTRFGKECIARTKDIRFGITEMEEQEDIKVTLIEVVDKIDKIIKKKSFRSSSNGNEYYNKFSLEEIVECAKIIETYFQENGSIEEQLIYNEDDPIPFDINHLAGYIETLAQDTSSAQYIEFMTIRIKSLLRNTLISSVIGAEPEISLLDWINENLSNKNKDKGKLCIIDLSILPLEITHLVVAAISRLIFESLQRYRRCYGYELPTLLVMEEAHTFIKKYSNTEDDFSADKLCSMIFERIAREGRKYGLGLMVSSQRPSELSPTVLSQCNSYILHRIVNDKDQEMVKRLVPDNLGNMLDELPSLPTQKAIVLGSAIAIPTLVDINDLPKNSRPKSDNPDFWNIWIGEKERSLDWKPIVDEWQKKE